MSGTSTTSKVLSSTVIACRLATRPASCLALAPLTTTILSRIPPQHVGAASGVLNTGFWTGNALGVAISGVILYGVVSHSTGGNPYPQRSC